MLFGLYSFLLKVLSAAVTICVKLSQQFAYLKWGICFYISTYIEAIIVCQYPCHHRILYGVR